VRGLPKTKYIINNINTGKSPQECLAIKHFSSEDATVLFLLSLKNSLEITKPVNLFTKKDMLFLQWNIYLKTTVVDFITRALYTHMTDWVKGLGIFIKDVVSIFVCCFPLY